MNDDLHKLLAGYTTGTLTEAERKALFEAALTDEELFASICEDEPLRELLADPAARAELLARIDPAPVTFRERFAAWLRRPTVMASFGSLAAAVLVISIFAVLRHEEPPLAARLSTPPSARQMIHTQDPSQGVAETQRETRPAQVERSLAVTTPAAPPRRKEEAQPRSAPAPAEAPAMQAPGPAADVVPAPVVEQPQLRPAAPLGSARMAALPGEAAEAARMFPMAKATGQAAVPIRPAVLKKSASGTYSEVDPEKSAFSAGDTVRIRFEPAENGLVTIQGATPQPISRMVTKGQRFETGDVLVGAEDMRLVISFRTGSPAAQRSVNALRTSGGSEPMAAQPVEIVLHVEKP